ncbi:ACP S-malonyltransferase [Succiniclasticum ruminis]|uniref:Malonyl CoA-acyl carrier protein transacylase n=1 Tax=Succiniclasticum ruminis DSM 9236 TaxID=1123323 RepID=A0A1I1ZPD9_9FIRM|nr:ACP S-malonyltransferase [Succiniclasticum ruminis]SFE33492.1 [acyl-carrier-protein] S-malonyltransferase [Succiniclasticum ruminis DSM 9236]
MSKVAFVFPGQGSQKVGMCKDFYDNYACAKKVFEEADDALGFSITKMCFEGPEEDLRLTKYTQPAILTCSVAALAVMREHGLECEAAGGHSLGEYSALVAADVMRLQDAVVAVHKRGEFMQEAVPVGEGAMAAVMGLTPDEIVAICQNVEAECGEEVQAVNFNCPGQVVIAGATKAVDKASEALKAAGAKRAIPLPVSAPFHSTLMKPAAERLKEVLDKIEFRDAKFPVFSNVTAEPVVKAEEIRALLVKQAASPVKWEMSMHRMIKDGFDTFVEVGPGKVLTGFTRKIDRAMNALNVEDMASLEKTLAYFKEVR